MSENKLNIIEIKSIRNPKKPETRKNSEELPKSGIFPENPEDLATLMSV
jgi:hypothetical protein